MDVRRGAVTLIVNDLLREGLIFEGATGETVRGRKPTFLYIDSRRRAVVAADIRASETFVMLADLLGKPMTGAIGFPTVRDPKKLIDAAGRRASRRCSPIIPKSMRAKASAWSCPAWSSTRRCACCMRRRWAGATSICAKALAAATGLPVQIENSGRACALAQAWAMREDLGGLAGDLVFVSVSDGVGVGVMIHGEVLRGRHNIAGEFGHLPLSLDGPRCSCGSNGCWEAYVSNPGDAGALLRPPVRSSRPDAASSSATSPSKI